MSSVVLALSGIARAQNVDNIDQGTTWPTIQAAVDAADPRDTLELVAPSFDEAVVIDRSISVLGRGATLSSPGSTVFVLAAGVTFTLRDAIVQPTVGDLDLRGISATDGGNTVRVFDSTFLTADPAFDGSAIDAVDPDALVVTNTTFSNITAGTDAATNGGAIHVVSLLPVPVTLTDVSFLGLEAGFSGGALFASGVDLSCTRCRFERTRARTGGAIYAIGGSSRVSQGSFCVVRSTSASDSGAFVAEQQTAVVTGSVFAENDGNALAGALLGLAGSRFDVTNSTFVANGGAAAVDLAATTDPSVFINTLFVDNDGWGIVVGPEPVLAYDWFDGNGAGDVSGAVPGPTNGSGPPLLTAFSRDGDCSDDQLWPQLGSPLLDAGDPAILDPDGSRSDIGSSGGPTSDPALHDDADGDGFSFVHDCDDGQGAVFPGAEERCNGRDDDCDEAVDDDDTDVIDQDTFHADCDSDGQGAGAALLSCEPPPLGPVCGGGWLADEYVGPDATADCDDDDATVFLGATELCGTVDHDCDGDTGDVDPDAADPSTFYLDCDGDNQGAGDPHPSCTVPVVPPGCDSWSILATDCDDDDPTAHAGADERCAAGDQDCDGDPDADAVDAVLYFVDDHDGFGSTDRAPLCGVPPIGFSDVSDDCDDDDDLVFPGARDGCGDGIDQDCNDTDGQDADLRDWYVDADRDGYGDPSSAALVDCNYELPGFTTNTLDCDDADPQVNPGEAEICNGIDDDCSAAPDDVPGLCDVPPPEIGPVFVRPVGSCSTTGGASSGWLGLLLLVARLRRVRS